MTDEPTDELDAPDESFEEQEKLLFEIRQKNPEYLGWAMRETLYELKEDRWGERVTLTSIFPSLVYGVSSVSPMNPETAIEIAGALVEWANPKIQEREDQD